MIDILRRLISASIGAVVVVAGSGIGLAAAPKSFDTPEAAVEHYVKSVAAADLDAAMQGFAVDDVAGRIDFAAYARILPALQPATMYAPPNHKMYVQMNKIRLMADLAHATKLFAYGLLFDAPLDEAPMKSANDAEIDAFMKAVDPTRLKPLKIVRIDQPSRSVTSTAKVIALNKKQAAPYGADDQTERIALYQLGGQHYWGGFGLLRYGKIWRISRFESYFAGPHRGVVEKTTPSEYEARLK